MCAGIAVGALAVLVVAAATAAEVASGGLATPVIIALAAAGAATAATLTSGIVLAVKSHNCDYTLESEWLHFHTKVHFDEANAILHNSLLKFNKGGMVSIFLDDTVAQEAALDISKNNNEEVSEHKESQFFEGLITGVTSLTGMGVCVGLGFSVWDYSKDESKSEKEQGEYTTKRYEDEEKSEYENEKLGEAEGERIKTFGWRETTAGAGSDIGMAAKEDGLKGAKEYFTESSLKPEGADFFGHGWKASSVGLIAGLAGAVVSVWIDNNSNTKEGHLFNEVVDQSLIIRENDLLKNSNNINVIAKEI